MSVRDRRLASVGLRWRIAIWATVLLLACLAIAFAAVYSGTGSRLRDQIDGRLGTQLRQLSTVVARAGGRPTGVLAGVARRYIAGRPFSATSTLLFVRVPGQPTSTNRPELFRNAPADNDETAAQQSRERVLGQHLLAAPPGYSTQSLPDVGDLRLLTRALPVARARGGDLRVVVGAGQPLEPVSDAQEGVLGAFILAGALAVLGATLGGLLLGSRTSRPLRRMASVAERVGGGDLHPRIHVDSAAGAEIRVLAHAFNHMLDRLGAAFASQRDFVADASHELRTPLTVIRGQLEVLAEHPSPTAAEVRRVGNLLRAEVTRIDRLVEDLLLLAELEQAELVQIEPFALAPFVGELWDSSTVIAQRRFALGAVPDGGLEADPDRLAQALRNLLTNAIKHTAEPDGRVTMRVEARPGGRVAFAVEDDGPGIPPEERQRVFDRFHRTDPARGRATGGAGLGLAIVAAIAQAHGGTVHAEEAVEGGALLVLEIPGFTPARPQREASDAASATDAVTGAAGTEL